MLNKREMENANKVLRALSILTGDPSIHHFAKECLWSGEREITWMTPNRAKGIAKALKRDYEASQ